MTTLAQAKAYVRTFGLVLSKKDGEYRVSFQQRPGIPRARYEDTAYYTNDIDDAVATARSMAAHGAHEFGGRRRTRQRHGNAEIAPGKFYAYKGQKVWLDAVPGGYFAMVQGTAIQARGKTPGEALKRLRDRMDAGGPASANRSRTRRTRFGDVSGSLTAKYDVFRVSGLSGNRRHVSGPHTWQIAWRKASKLNDQTRKDFREGRIMYDVPEYVVEKRA